ncbi:MFS transporter [Nocardia sp. CA-129566]|uniref:MFS transporter n=1 Tax=Nocardia sp. CA-129566 TaxID=3239976 RepID=UPI003D982F3B
MSDASTKSRRVALASLIGTTIEYYDFFIYGTAAALVFSAVFFPSVDPLTGTLLSLSTFAVAFIARPIGAIVIGHYGDRIGRKSMLVFTLMSMGGTTLLIGLIPSHAAIGVAAPILLVVLRFIQGFALGGEYGGAVLMATEHAEEAKHGSRASLVQLGAPLGLILANVVFFALAALSPHAFETWGWRVPFILSIVLVIFGVAIRMKIEESPSFKQVIDSGAVAEMPVVEVFRTSTLRVLLVALTSVSVGVTFYVGTVYSLTYGTKQQGYSRNTMLAIVILAMIAVIIGVLLFGKLVDKVGSRKVFMYGSAGMIAAAPVFIATLQTGNIALTIVGYLILFIPYSAAWSALSSMLAACFDTRIRYTGLSIGFTLGQVLGSAFAPIVATELLSRTRSLWSVAAYVVFAAALSAVTAALIRERRLAPSPTQDLVGA